MAEENRKSEEVLNETKWGALNFLTIVILILMVVGGAVGGSKIINLMEATENLKMDVVSLQGQMKSLQTNEELQKKKEKDATTAPADE